jgi:hypothetical protein
MRNYINLEIENVSVSNGELVGNCCTGSEQQPLLCIKPKRSKCERTASVVISASFLLASRELDFTPATVIGIGE